GLGEGLVPSASRESLSVWVLGNPAGAPAISDRFTATADLSAVALTPAARADMVSDIAAAMGATRDVQARQFRFAGLIRTASLQARSESLVSSSARRAKNRSPGSEIAAQLDIAGGSIRTDFVPVEIDPSPLCSAARAGLRLIRDRHLRVVS
ncbi:hypothetical protein HR12_47800, partial [Microbacterium sp. SUBG005]